MLKGFDNDKYIALQAEHIRERIKQFGGKLYLEFGGKLFDDYHASRVLPGFEPDSKIRMLKKVSPTTRRSSSPSTRTISRNRRSAETSASPTMRTCCGSWTFSAAWGFLVGSVVITCYANQPNADAFRRRLNVMGITSYLHYPIEGYPYDIDSIVSESGYGKNDFIETTRPLVVVTAPGRVRAKMATCLSQLYHENLRG